MRTEYFMGVRVFDGSGRAHTRRTTPHGATAAASAMVHCAAALATVLAARIAVAAPPAVVTSKTAVASADCEKADLTLQITGVGDPVTQRLPLDLMVVFDRSGSMDDAGGNPLQPITDAKTAAKGLIDQLSGATDRAGLTSFSTTATLDRALTSNLAAVKSSIDSISVSGNTNIGGGVQRGQQELGTNGRSAPTVRVMVVLTDGVANRTASGTSCATTPTSANACTQDAINQAATAKAAGTVVFTIGLNLNNLPSATASLARSTLTAMASNAQSYFEAPTSAQLQGIFNQIATIITTLAGSNIMLTDVLPPDVHYVSGSASPAPTTVSGQTLTWNLGLVNIGNSITVTLRVQLAPASSNQLVDVYPTSRIDYSDYQGSAASAAFPETHVDPLFCPTATPTIGATNTASATATTTVTSTATATVSATPTSTSSVTASPTTSATATDTPRATVTPTATPTPFCGDGHVDPGESCDDGNMVSGDGCDADCTVTPACTLQYTGTNRFVGSCGSPGYGDIQAAVDAATDGDVISLCPGTYSQSVAVTKQVKVAAAIAGTVTVHTAGTAFDIRRSGVQIDGLTIQADAGAAIAADSICPLGEPTCTQPNVGSHLTIANNVIVNTATGIGWHREIDCVRIVSNTMTDNARHIEILQNEGPPAAQVSIDQNTITGGGQSGAAIALSGLGVTVSANIVQNAAAAAVVIANAPGAGATQIIENTIDHSGGDGITVKAGADGTIIQNNNITHNAIGLANESGAGTLDATSNWWASQTGPSGLFTGHGDRIVNRVSGGTTQFIEFLCKPFPGGFPSVLGVCSTEVAELRLLIPGRAPDLATRGRYVVFESSDDLDVDPRTVRDNADGSQEVFLLNRQPKKSQTGVCVGGTKSCNFADLAHCFRCNGFRQCPGDPGADPILLGGDCVVITQLSDGTAPHGSANPRLSRAAKTVVYASNDDQLSDNADESMEVRSWTRRAFEHNLPSLTPLSSGAAVVHYDNPVPSLDGKYVVMESNGDPIGENPDGNTEIFALQTKQHQWVQITHSLPPVENHRPTTVTGHRIVFDSNGDLTGHNADGNRELFVARLRASGMVELLQVTDTTVSAVGDTVENRSGDLDGHSALAVFSSNGDFVGRNHDGNREIFSWYRPTGAFEQLTVSTAGDNANPVVNQSQRFIVFESTADLTGSGANNRRIFQLDRENGKLTLLSRSRVGTNQIARIPRRRFVVWESNANLTGNNPSGDWVIYLFDRKKD
jgi:cysteine-rich repeat protein